MPQLQEQFQPVELSIGNLTIVPIIENDQQFQNDVDFACIGFTGNTLLFGKNNTEIEFMLSLVDEFAEGTTKLDYVNTAPGVAHAAGNALTSKTNYITGISLNPGLPADIDNFDGVKVDGIYSGIDAFHTCNSRQLRTSYDISSGQGADNIKLDFDAKEVRVDATTGNIEIVLESDTERNRVIVLHSVKWTIGGITTARQWKINPDDTLSLDLTSGDLSNTEPLTIEQIITYGPFFHEYDAANIIDQAGVTESTTVVSRAFNSINNGTIKTGRDVVVVNLNQDTKVVNSITYITGSGDDVGNGIKINNTTDATYIVGATDSDDFPIVNAPSGTKGFVIKVDSTLKTIDSGIYIADSEGGKVFAHDVAIALDDNIVVVGLSERRFALIEAKGFHFKADFPRPVDEELAQDYFVTEYDDDLDQVVHSAPILGPVGIALPIAITSVAEPSGNPDIPDEELVVGVVKIDPTAGAACTIQTTEMSEWANSISGVGFPGIQNPDKIWGKHPINWKRHTSTNTFNFNNLNQAIIPQGGIYNVDATTLKYFRKQHCFYST